MSGLSDTEKVRLLLTSMNDYLPSPKVSRVYANALAGPQASSYVPCGNCAKTGRVRNRKPCTYCLGDDPIPHFCSMCPACDGRGQRKRTKGDPEYDAYSGQTMEEAVAARDDDALKRTSVRRPQGSGRDDSLDMTEDPVWREKARYDAHGSYPELQKKLELLKWGYPSRYEMLMCWAKLHDDSLWRWSETVLSAVDETILLLSRRMLKPIRVPGWVEAVRNKENGRRRIDEKQAA